MVGWKKGVVVPLPLLLTRESLLEVLPMQFAKFKHYTLAINFIVTKNVISSLGSLPKPAAKARWGFHISLGTYPPHSLTMTML